MIGRAPSRRASIERAFTLKRDARFRLSSSRTPYRRRWGDRATTTGRKQIMSRLTVLAFTAALALGSVSIATEASAAHGGHGGHAGHWSGGGHWGGGRFGGYGYRRGFGIGVYPAYYGSYYGCWRGRRVLTPFGWRWQRVNVCYNYY
jgi:hypothetical protein